MTRWIATFGLLLTAFAGCSIADSLANAPCDSDDDCAGGGYACVRTVHQQATNSPGLCRDDGQCAAGQQEGCMTSGGACTTLDLFVVETGQGSFCCDSLEASITNISPDGTSAQCLSCPTDLCAMQTDATEICLGGESRCEVIETATGCGCRIPAEDIENSDCDDDATCGDGFVCTRTLEQEEEPDEALQEERNAEPGWCRPTDAPECVQGAQEGCRGDDSCNSGFSRKCTSAGRCFCCDQPSDSNNFGVHVYDEADAEGTSAACVQCADADCTEPGSVTCTQLEDASCVLVDGGPCGCTPPG